MITVAIHTAHIVLLSYCRTGHDEAPKACQKSTPMHRSSSFRSFDSQRRRHPTMSYTFFIEEGGSREPLPVVTDRVLPAIRASW